MRTLKTYIVEDSKVVRGNLTSVLEELAAIEVVGTADDERTAVEWLATEGNEVDLVIIDVFLREGTGLGVLRAAKSASPRSSLVVLTNFNTADLNEKCMELGATRVFDKSNELEALVLYCGHLAEGDVLEPPPASH
jgi:DNA-binding NarL/FixJ family response regulator